MLLSQIISRRQIAYLLLLQSCDDLVPQGLLLEHLDRQIDNIPPDFNVVDLRRLLVQDEVKV
jgi:hypothetical protein